jgi:uncharacterized membrane protein
VQTEPDLSNSEQGSIAQTRDNVVRRFVLTRWSVLRQSPDIWFLLSTGILLTPLFYVPSPVVRIPLGIILVLFVPGFATVSALFRYGKRISIITVVGISIGLSIATVPFLALFLHLLSVEIRPLSIALSLSIWILMWAVVGLMRRDVRVGHDLQRQESLTRRSIFSGIRSVRPSLGTSLLATVLVLVVVLGYSVVSATTGHDIDTEFYVLGSDGQAQEYPRNISVDQLVLSQLGITNGDEGSRNYYVHVSTSDFANPEQSTSLTTVGPITVEKFSTAEPTILWSLNEPGSDKAVRFDLYRSGDAVPYRELVFFVNVTTPAEPWETAPSD